MKKLRAQAALLLIASLILTVAGPANAATAPTLGTLESFGVLAGSTVTNTGPTVIGGDVGVSPGSAITGFPPGIVTPPGRILAGGAVADQAQLDSANAYNSLRAQPCDQNLTDEDLGGKTLLPGTYCFATSAQLTGTLTLDTLGNPDAVFIFQVDSTLTTASNSSVEFINGVSCHVYWQIGSSATLGTTTDFVGNILASASITANTGATVQGRLLASTGAVTLDSNTVNRPSCNPPVSDDTTEPTPTPTESPTAVVTPPTDSPAPTSPTVVGPDTVIPAGTVVSPEDIMFSDEPGAVATTTSTPTSSQNPSEAGSPVTFTTVVTQTGSNAPVTAGTVTFISDSTVLGSAPLDSQGRATFTTSSLTPGNHKITAVYQGGPGAGGSISKSFIQRTVSGSRARGGPTNALVRTGMDTMPLGLSGAGSILLGIGLLLEDRRRTLKKAA